MALGAMPAAPLGAWPEGGRAGARARHVRATRAYIYAAAHAAEARRRQFLAVLWEMVARGSHVQSPDSTNPHLKGANVTTISSYQLARTGPERISGWKSMFLSRLTAT